MNIEIKKLAKNEVKLFRELIELFIVVFEEEGKEIASDEHLNKLLLNPYFNVFIAQIEDRIVGGLTTYEMPRYYSEKSELYLYDMAVDTKLHNKGIGKKLISELRNYAKENNIETIFVEAHAEDEQAVKFYQSTFSEQEEVKHFNLYL